MMHRIERIINCTSMQPIIVYGDTDEGTIKTCRGILSKSDESMIIIAYRGNTEIFRDKSETKERSEQT